MTKEWISWLNEPIYLDGSVSNILKRKEAMYIFLTEGILPMIHSAGYRFRHDKKIMIKLLLSALYFYSTGFKMPLYEQYFPNLEDHHTEFNDVFDTITWSRFWDKWGSFEDFAEDSKTHKFRFFLPVLLWSWIDLNESPRVIRLDALLTQLEQQEEGIVTKGRDDLYLQETARHDYQDRHWH